VKASALYLAVAQLRERTGAADKADLARSKSIELLQRVVARDPADQATRALLTERFVQLGEAYFDKGTKAQVARLKSQYYSYAIFNLERAIEVDPKSENRAHDVMGRLLNHLERHEEALLHFQKIKDELQNFVESIYSYGESCLKLRRFIEASTSLRRVLQIRPDHGRAWRDLGLTFWNLKALDRALPCFEKASTLLPDDPRAHFYLAQLRLRERRYDDAKAGFERVVALTQAAFRNQQGERRSDTPAGLHMAARQLLEELPSRRAADTQLRALGGRTRGDEGSRSRPAGRRLTEADF
jgi:tetratricopeptide (TPR) repeat protein